MKMFVGCYNKSVILTYLGVASAVFGMVQAVSGNMKLAMICMIISGVSDIFDGTVARMCKRTDLEKEFGVQIDSLADMVNFSVYPVILGLGLGQLNWYNTLIYIFYVLAAVCRLAYFNIVTAVNTDPAEAGIYHGLPVTASALIFTAMWIIGTLCGGTAINVIFPVAMLVTAFCFILNVRLHKPHGIWYAVLGALALAVLIGVIAVG